MAYSRIEGSLHCPLYLTTAQSMQLLLCVAIAPLPSPRLLSRGVDSGLDITPWDDGEDAGINHTQIRRPMHNAHRTTSCLALAR